MRVMLFGATGQLGTSLARAFAGNGIACSALSRKECDFASITREALAALIGRHAPTILINAAAWAAVDDAEEHKSEAQRVNAVVPGWLARTARQQDIPLVHFSTDYVFDGERGAPYSESSKTNPINHYGVTKCEGEEAILASGASAYIFRLQLLYQATGNSFFCRMRQLLAERDTLRVAADQLSSPTSVTEVTQAIMKALPRIGTGTFKTGIYHMAAAGHTSRHGFTCAIREEMLARGMPVKTQVIEAIVSEEFPSPAPRPKDVRLSTEKLASVGIALPHWRARLKQVMDEVHEPR